MNVGIITIGNELLNGFTVDTNAAWMGQEVLKCGSDVRCHCTISDDADEIIRALGNMKEKVDVILSTGGLGPTHDDVTATAWSTFFEDQPVFDEEYWNELQKRFRRSKRDIPDLNRNQAMRPQKGKPIPNPTGGSARGLYYHIEGVHYFAMPGVPREMQGMMKKTVLPFLRKISPSDLFVSTLRTTGIPESELAEKVESVLQQYGSLCKVAFLPQITGVDIRISSKEERHLVSLETALFPHIKSAFYGTGDQSLEGVVGNQLKAIGLTIATAESCTGGLLSHRLTNVSGSSAYMKGGVISYSNDAKIDILDVSGDTLRDYGAVSEETARKMAHGVQKLLESDIGVAITGIAGPTGGSDEKPVGLVYIGLVIRGETTVREFYFTKNREINKDLSTQAALNMVRLGIVNI